MTPDPNLFLSTIAAASSALVAIIGGLLIARFVGLDSDQRANRLAREAIDRRLTTARERATDAHNRLLWWEARDFLADGQVLLAIGQGITDLAELKDLARCNLTDDELRTVVAGTAREYATARATMDSAPPSEAELTDDTGWDRYRKRVSGTVKLASGTVSLRVWQMVFYEHVGRLRKQREREERERREREQREREQRAKERAEKSQSFRFLGAELAGFSELAGLVARPSPIQWPRMPTPAHVQEIAARRYDDLRSEDLRARQRVEDYEDELERLETEHGQMARPTGWLWLAVVILGAFAFVGIGLPTWVMSGGPTDLKQVRWVLWPFAGVLAALILFIVAYLRQLTSPRQPPAHTQWPWPWADRKTYRRPENRVRFR